VYSRRLGEIYGAAARADFIAAIAAVVGVLLFDTLPGLFIGSAMSLMLLLYRSSRPHIAELGKVPGTASQYADCERHPENERTDGIVVVRVESGLFFANIESVRTAIRTYAARPGTRAIVLDAETIAFIDVTAAQVLRELGDDLERIGVRLAIARDIGQVRDVLHGESVDSHAAVYPDVQSAVDALRHRSDGENE
jgi:anti-anti-sigma factor